MRIPRIGILFNAALVALLFVSPFRTQADGLDDAVRDLARRTLSMNAGDSAPCVGWQNRDAVSEARSGQLRTLFLNAAGLKPAEPDSEQGNCNVRVTIERTPSKIVVVAQIGTANEAQVLFAETPRIEVAAGAGSGAAPQIEKEMLMEQSRRILDAFEWKALTGGENKLILITEDAVVSYESSEGNWTLTWSQPIPTSDEIQRAPQGELKVNPNAPDAIQILLPGRVCETSAGGAEPVRCQSREVTWREAILPAACDGEGDGLRTDTGDWSEPDRILLIHPPFSPSETPVTAVKLPGPVLSLAPGNLANHFTATVRNLATGNYEVYRITLSCRN